MPDNNSELDGNFFEDGSWEEMKEEESFETVNRRNPEEKIPEKPRPPKQAAINLRLITREGETIQILRADDLYTNTENGATALYFKNDNRVLFRSEDLFSPLEQAALTRDEMDGIGKEVTESVGRLLKEEMDSDRVTRRSVVDLSQKANNDIAESLKRKSIDRYLSSRGEQRIDGFYTAKEGNESLARNLLNELGIKSHTMNYPASLLMVSTDSAAGSRRNPVPVIRLSDVDSWTAEKILGQAMQRAGMAWQYSRRTSEFSAWPKTPDGRRPLLNDYRRALPPKQEEYEQYLQVLTKYRIERETAEKNEQLKRANIYIRFITKDGEALVITKADELEIRTQGRVTTLAFKNDPERLLFQSKDLFLPEEAAALSGTEMESIGKAVARSLRMMIEKEMDPDRITRRSVIDLSSRSDIDYIGSFKKAYIEKCLSLGGEERAHEYQTAREENDRLARNMFQVLGIETVTKHYPASLLMTTDNVGKDGIRLKSTVPLLQLSNVGQRTAAPVLGKVVERYGFEWSYNKSIGVFSAWTRQPQKSRPVLSDFRAFVRPDAKEYDQMLYTMAKARADAEKADRSYPVAHGYPKQSTDQIFSFAQSFSVQENLQTNIQNRGLNEVWAKAYLTGMGFSRLTRREYELQIVEAKTISDLYKGETEPYAIVVRMGGVPPQEASKLMQECDLKGLSASYDRERGIMSVSAYDGPDRPLFEGNLREPDYARLRSEDFENLTSHVIGIEEANRVIQERTGTGYLAMRSESAFDNIKEAEYLVVKYEAEQTAGGRPKSREIRAALHTMRATAKDRILDREDVMERASRVRDERLLEKGINTPLNHMFEYREMSK